MRRVTIFTLLTSFIYLTNLTSGCLCIGWDTWRLGFPNGSMEGYDNDCGCKGVSDIHPYDPNDIGWKAPWPPWCHPIDDDPDNLFCEHNGGDHYYSWWMEEKEAPFKAKLSSCMLT